MPRYRIYFDLKHCEGNFDCVTAAPDFFIALPGGDKVDLIGATPSSVDDELLYLDIEEEDLEVATAAADGCGPQVIRVMDLETGETLAGPDRLPIETEHAEAR